MCLTFGRIPRREILENRQNPLVTVPRRSSICPMTANPGLRIARCSRHVVGINTMARHHASTSARSRTEPASWVERARILLAYRADPSAHAVGEMVDVTHQSVLRCLRRAVRFGVMAALDDSPRPGKAPEITADARAWLLSLACQKAKDLGYPQELWTTRLLASHVREHARSRFCAPRLPRQVMSHHLL